MTLYQLKGEWLSLMDMLETEEDQQVINDTLESLNYEIEEKADNYARVIRELESRIDGLTKEIDRMMDTRRVIKNNISRLKGNLQDAMILTGKENFKTDLFSFGIQNNPPAVVLDTDKLSDIPEEFLIPQEPKLDRKSMKKYLEMNDVAWGHLEQNRGLRIR